MSEFLPPDVIDFLERERVTEIQQEGDISVSQASKQWGVSGSTALSRLRELVEEGKLTEHNGVLLNRAKGFFFRIVDKKQLSTSSPPSSSVAP